MLIVGVARFVAQKSRICVAREDWLLVRRQFARALCVQMRVLAHGLEELGSRIQVLPMVWASTEIALADRAAQAQMPKPVAGRCACRLKHCNSLVCLDYGLSSPMRVIDTMLSASNWRSLFSTRRARMMTVLSLERSLKLSESLWR